MNLNVEGRVLVRQIHHPLLRRFDLERFDVWLETRRKALLHLSKLFLHPAIRQDARSSVWIQFVQVGLQDLLLRLLGRFQMTCQLRDACIARLQIGLALLELLFHRPKLRAHIAESLLHIRREFSLSILLLGRLGKRWSDRPVDRLSRTNQWLCPKNLLLVCRRRSRLHLGLLLIMRSGSLLFLGHGGVATRRRRRRWRLTIRTYGDWNRLKRLLGSEVDKPCFQTQRSVVGSLVEMALWLLGLSHFGFMWCTTSTDSVPTVAVHDAAMQCQKLGAGRENELAYGPACAGYRTGMIGVGIANERNEASLLSQFRHPT